MTFKCQSKVRYTKILAHMMKVKEHQSLLMVSLLCPVCRVSVLPTKVHRHMPKCCPPPAQPTNHFKPPPHSPPLFDSERTAAQLASAFTLSGLSVCLYSPSFAALRIILDSYLVTNFVPKRHDGINCLRMYKNYQETIKSQGHREVFSPTMFVDAVNELAKVHWNIDVSPFSSDCLKKRSRWMRLEFCQLYFKGFRKIDTD